MVKSEMSQKGIINLYRYWSAVYDFTLIFWNNIFARRLEKILMKFLKNLGKEVKVLDLACGTGINIKRLNKAQVKVSEYLGIDMSKKMLKKASKKFPSHRFINHEILDFKNDKKFDLIFCTWALSHFKNPSEVVNKYYENLNRGGHFILLFQSEFERNTILARLIGKIVNLFSSALVKQDEVKKFPQNFVINKKTLWGYAQLLIIKKP